MHKNAETEKSVPALLSALAPEGPHTVARRANAGSAATHSEGDKPRRGGRRFAYAGEWATVWVFVQSWVRTTDSHHPKGPVRSRGLHDERRGWAGKTCSTDSFFVPPGTSENSPVIYHWVRATDSRLPKSPVRDDRRQSAVRLAAALHASVFCGAMGFRRRTPDSGPRTFWLRRSRAKCSCSKRLSPLIRNFQIA